MVLGDDPELAWDHACIELLDANTFVDIRGEHSRTELRKAWFGNRITPLDQSIADGPFGAYQKHLGARSFFDVTFEDAMFVAKRVLDGLSRWAA